ncbi:unnamed protein product, partial [Darwinula stevensoni]
AGRNQIVGRQFDTHGLDRPEVRGSLPQVILENGMGDCGRKEKVTIDEGVGIPIRAKISLRGMKGDFKGCTWERVKIGEEDLMPMAMRGPLSFRATNEPGSSCPRVRGSFSRVVSLALAFGVLAILVYALACLLARPDYWEKRGFKAKTPVYPLFGNLWKAWTSEQIFRSDINAIHQIGKVYGTYDGRHPTLVVADPDMIKEILVKQIDVFTDRRPFPAVQRAPLVRRFVSLMKGQEWKDLRSSLTPVFSSGKIKRMSPMIEECAQRLVKNFQSSIEKSSVDKSSSPGVLDLKAHFGAFTLDVIATCAFGTRLNSLGSPDDPFIKYARKFFINPRTSTPIGILPFMFPSIMSTNLTFFSREGLRFFADVVQQLLKERKDSGKMGTRGDFIDLLLEVQSSDLKGNVDDETITAQAVLFFLAGYDTTATLLTMSTFCLATNPAVQTKLQNELQKAGPLNRESILHCSYLDHVINEALRLYPPAIRTERLCGKDIVINGYKIEKGIVVHVPIYAMHHLEEFFPDPDKFIPERFADDQVLPYTFLPFGQGSRNCIGMRFALEEAKIALAHVISAFEFSRGPETEVPPRDHPNMFLYQPLDVKIKPVVRRFISILKGQEWKDLRSSITPVFSSGKIKRMSPMIEECAQRLIKNFQSSLEKSSVDKSSSPGVLDLKAHFGSFTLDVIATCAFGTRLNSLGTPDDPFIKHARKFFINEKTSTPLGVLPFMFPSIATANLALFSREGLRFFTDVVQQLLQERKDSGKMGMRGDFIDLLLEVQSSDLKGIVDDETIISQAVLFFVAGYDTTATLLTMSTYCLAMHPAVQTKLWDELKKTGPLTRESILNCSYLDHVINEALRLYPPAIRTERLCGKDAVVNGYKIEKGIVVHVPIYAMHHLEEFFPKPYQFIPERFADDQVLPYTFLPFGQGSRNCIGMRFALEEAKIALAHVLAAFEFSRATETEVPPRDHPNMFLYQPLDIKIKVYGTYDGSHPTLVVADPDMIKEILVKQIDA